MSTLSRQRLVLIEALTRAASEAEHCASVATGLRDMSVCVQKCRDAAALCRLAAEFLARGSELEHWILLASVLACEDCARECEAQLGAFFADCALVCRHVVKQAAALSGGVLTESERPDRDSGIDGDRNSLPAWVYL